MSEEAKYYRFHVLRQDGAYVVIGQIRKVYEARGRMPVNGSWQTLAELKSSTHEYPNFTDYADYPGRPDLFIFTRWASVSRRVVIEELSDAAIAVAMEEIRTDAAVRAARVELEEHYLGIYPPKELDLQVSEVLRNEGESIVQAIRKIEETPETRMFDCPHWEPGKITLRKGCTACEATSVTPEAI